MFEPENIFLLKFFFNVCQISSPLYNKHLGKIKSESSVSAAFKMFNKNQKGNVTFQFI